MPDLVRSVCGVAPYFFGGFKMTLSRFFKVALLQISMVALMAGIAFSQLAMAQEVGILAVGDGVVTGFSGVVEPALQEPPLTAAQILDETLINRDGISARINYLAAPGFVWDARAWPSNKTLEFFARDVGQVFGVTIDDAEKPNIYLSASSAYGLQIVSPDADNDGRPEREKAGGKDAVWMDGQWGKADTKGEDGSKGGPGSIWKVDGVSGEVSLFANVQLDGIDNAGAGLGNIVYVPSLKQIFVSDLSTGMIHRYAMDGTEVEIFDHGVTGRTSAELNPVKYDADARLDITSSDFDPEDADTWGLTDEDRRVHGLAFNNGRLYYAVRGGSQIWSVGFDKDTGKFLDGAQWEIDVPEKPKALPITDMLFTHKGALVLAQRGEVTSTYDYAGLGAQGKARVYRYWLESPEDDPATPSRWIAEPEEHAVGFEKNNRQTSGGLALNHGYTPEGYLDTSVCEASLWTTGDDLRQSEVAELVTALTPGGPLKMDGLQGMPAGPVKQYEKGNNTPPWASYMLDNEPDNTGLADIAGDPLPYSDALTEGWTGDIETLRTNCDVVASGGGAGYWGGAGYPWSTPSYVYNTDGGGDPDVVDPVCTPGVDCPVVAQCAAPRGQFTCDSTTGTYTYLLDAGTSFQADTIKITGTSPGISIANGPMVPLGPPANLVVTGLVPGQLMSVGLCIFDSTAMKSGKPFDCCKTSVTTFAPAKACVKKTAN
jgi:hypothetical protein